MRAFGINITAGAMITPVSKTAGGGLRTFHIEHLQMPFIFAMRMNWPQGQAKLFLLVLRLFETKN